MEGHEAGAAAAGVEVARDGQSPPASAEADDSRRRAARARTAQARAGAPRARRSRSPSCRGSPVLDSVIATCSGSASSPSACSSASSCTAHGDGGPSAGAGAAWPRLGAWCARVLAPSLVLGGAALLLRPVLTAALRPLRTGATACSRRSRWRWPRARSGRPRGLQRRPWTRRTAEARRRRREALYWVARTTSSQTSASTSSWSSCSWSA